MWEDFRLNYTDDVRVIFDLGSAIFAAHGDIAPARAADEEERDSARKHAFYEAVAGHMQCTEIERWLSTTSERAIEAPRLRGPLMRALISTEARRVGKEGVRTGRSRWSQ